jgi:hypothetical protein
MPRKKLGTDLREIGSYGIPEAAHFLIAESMPAAILQSRYNLGSEPEKM